MKGRELRRVALVSTATTKGGVWRHIEDLGLVLQRSGIEVTIGVRPAATTLQAAAENVGLPWEPLHRTVRPSIDVWHVHLHDTYDPLALAVQAVRRPFGPTVVTEHLPRNHASDASLGPQHQRTRGAATAKTFFKRVQVALSSEMIAVGTSSRRFLEARYRLSHSRLSTVHNGILAPPYSPPVEPSHSPLRVVTVGSLISQKGHDVLIEAATLSAQPWHLTVVGEGPRLDMLRARAPRSRVRFTGWVDDPLGEIRAADVVCLPSRWESFPYVALEAGAAGRPIVGSMVDGLDEIVLDGRTGILVPPECPQELAAALDRLSTNRHLVNEFGRAAHADVMLRFPLDQMVSGVVSAYHRACCSSRDP